MSVASLENCKSLYELSGWVGTLLFHNLSDDNMSGREYRPIVAKSYHHVGVYENIVGCDECEGSDVDTVPAYDFDYVLEKLRANSRVKEVGIEIYVDGTDIHSEVRHDVHIRCSDLFRVQAKTADDAIVLLAIKLFEAEVLK